MDNFLYFYYYIIGRLRRIYFMAIPENKQEFKMSRIYFTIDGATANSIIQLVGGTFIAALMTTLGISDSANGMISAIAVLACCIQPISSAVTANLKKYKFFVCFTAIVHRLLFAYIFFIPLHNMASNYKIILFVACFLLGHVFLQVGIPAASDWIASLVPQKLRGKYFGIRDLIGVFFMSLSMIIAAITLDYYKNSNNLLTGFLVIGGIVFILAVINIIALSKVKEPKIAYTNETGKEMHGRLAKSMKTKEKNNFWADVKGAVTHKKYKKVIFLFVIWQSLLYLSMPYNAIYYIKELNLPYTFITAIVFGANMIRMAATPIWAKFGDKRGMAKTLKYAYGCMFLCNLLLAFTLPHNAYLLYPISMVIGSLGWAFIGVGLLGVQLDYIPHDKRISYMSINAAISGLTGFLASYAGGKILSYIQNNPLIIGNQNIYAQQVLNIMSCIIAVFLFFYIKFFLQKESKIVNVTDGRM